MMMLNAKQLQTSKKKISQKAQLWMWHEMFANFVYLFVHDLHDERLEGMDRKLVVVVVAMVLMGTPE